MLRYVCCDKTSDGRQIWEGQWWSRTHTHRNTHSLCPESRSRSNIILKLLMLKKLLSHDSYSLNMWLISDKEWMGRQRVYTQFPLVSLHVDAVAFLNWPAVCRRPLLLALYFPLCRKQTRKNLQMWTYKHLHMGMGINTCRNSHAILYLRSYLSQICQSIILNQNNA